MCGFVGFWDSKNNITRNACLNIAKSMADEIKERGPDSEGYWSHETNGLTFGFRRLAIVDLSPTGDQPMKTPSSRFTIVYNGEVYNAQELKTELVKLGSTFVGTSDTEVILAACEQWGVLEACQKLIGMFAFALWDETQQKLFLVRDRLGIKPLYWGFDQNVLLFGSQIKSFLKHPKFLGDLDRNALTSYFRFNYIPAPLSIYKGIQKSKPGTILVFDSQGFNQEIKFWDFEKVALQKQNQHQTQNIRKNELEIKSEFENLLKDAVKRRMIADVPLGAFLSGGIDSSTVVALMQAQSLQPIKTFSIGFSEEGYNEAHYALKVAKHLRTDHHELYVDSKTAQDVIPEIPNWCDEPFADVSQIPTFLVSKLARQHVTVSLSGDGGDELFAGYNRYLLGKRLWQCLEILPFWMRQMSARGLRFLPPNRWDKLSRCLPNRVRPKNMGDKLHKLAHILTILSPEILYKGLMSHWENPENLVLGGEEPVLFPWQTSSSHLPNFVENMQFMDTLTYLPDDILFKVDRASMAVSLEARVPLLDHRIVEYAWSLPFDMKIRDGQTKWLLRQVLDQYVPKDLIERPKMGFGVPIDHWLRGSLRDWAETLLSSEQLIKSGLNPAPIRARWLAHLSCQRNWQYSLWGVLMYQAWRTRWKS